MPSKYKLSPSSSDRFLTCTASLPHNTGFTESKHTLLGSLQHEVAALRLEEIFLYRDNSERIKYLTDPNNYYVSRNDDTLKVKWNSSCNDNVDNYVGYVKKLYHEYTPKHIFIEHKIKMRFYDNTINGVVDCAMVTEKGEVIIIDLKTGRGKVDANENNQMLMYAYGFIQELYGKTKQRAGKVIISIFQSVIYNTKAISYDLVDLITWYVSLAPPMNEINNDKLVYRPNEKACKYCQYKASCNARIKEGIL